MKKRTIKDLIDFYRGLYAKSHLDIDKDTVEALEKLQKIEQIINEKTATSDGQFFVGDWKIDKIKKVLESEG